MFLERVAVVRCRLELKYCECCGALWLREQGSEKAFCGACEAMWSDLPNHWIQGLKRKPARSHGELSSGIHAVSNWVAQAEGGRA